MNSSDHDSSSEEERESRDVIKANDIRLSQMRRGAQKRGGQSKLKSRYEGLQSYGDMMRAHGLERMQQGLGKLLSLHSAAELSSLCGCLGLAVQLKGATSKEQIMKYASETEELNEEKIGKILNFMWEGALWEYLHSIGHPIHSMLPDPKQTILRIWIDGGLLDASKTFVPHFVAREVKKRYEWITSEDIKTRLDKLRVCQEAAKVAERKVVSEHDYTNILTYFGQMGELRRMENATREYLISELEIARSRIDSNSDAAKMNRSQLRECEMHFISVAESLNTKLAFTEATCDMLMQERLTMEKDLQRLSNIVDSYIESEFNREQSGGGTITALRLKDEEKCVKSVRNLHRKMITYRNIQTASDVALRERSRSHVQEIDRLESVIRDLETELNDKINECEELEARANRAENELKLASRMISKAQLKASNTVHESWGSALRFAARVNEVELTLRKVQPVIVAGLNHKKNRVLSDVCKMLLEKLPIAVNPDEYSSIMNNFEMGLEDTASTAMRKLFRTNTASSPDGKKDKIGKDKPGSPGKTKAGGKPGSAGGAKKKGGAGSDNDTVKSKSTVGSAGTSASKGSKAPATGTGKKAPAASPIKEATGGKEKQTPKKAEAVVKSPTAKATPKAKK